MTGESAASAVPIIPDYELLRWIGGGSFGQVWLARNRHDGGFCAVKIIPKSRCKIELDLDRGWWTGNKLA